MMKRRSFLTMLGLSPVVAAVPAVAAKEIAPFDSLSEDLRKYQEWVGEGVRAVEKEFNRLEWYDDGSFAVNMGNSSIRTRRRENK